jgi:hypothetical protein
MSRWSMLRAFACSALCGFPTLQAISRSNINVNSASGPKVSSQALTKNAKEKQYNA